MTLTDIHSLVLSSLHAACTICPLPISFALSLAIIISLDIYQCHNCTMHLTCWLISLMLPIDGGSPLFPLTYPASLLRANVTSPLVQLPLLFFSNSLASAIQRTLFLLFFCNIWSTGTAGTVHWIQLLASTPLPVHCIFDCHCNCC